MEEIGDIRFAASSLAFSTLLSLIPFLVVVLAVFQYVGGLEEYYPKIESVMIGSLKEATGSTVSQYVRELLTKVKPSTIGVTGALFLLWASLGLIKNIDFAFQRVWKIKTRKPLYRRMHLYWILLVLVPVVLALVVGLRSFSVINEFSHHVESEFLFSLWLAIFLWVIYKIIPDTKVSLITSGFTAVLASFAISLVQKSFLWFSIKVFTHNKIYGSLASFPIFLVWLLVVWWVVLGGVALCAFLQQKMFKTL